MEPEISLPYSQASFSSFVMPPVETLPPLRPGDPIWGVFYLRIVLSPEETSRLRVFQNSLFFTGRSC